MIILEEEESRGCRREAERLFILNHFLLFLLFFFLILHIFVYVCGIDLINFVFFNRVYISNVVIIRSSSSSGNSGN